jgi:hypothetical protein
MVGRASGGSDLARRALGDGDRRGGDLLVIVTNSLEKKVVASTLA